MRYVLFFLVFCVAHRAAPSYAQSSQAAPIDIGVILPLTGEFAVWGERIRQGLLLAAEDSTHKFTLHFEDEGNCEATRTVNAVNALLSNKKIRLLFMGCLAGTKAAAPMVARSGGLMLSTGLLDDDVYRQKYPIINLATQLSTEAKYLAAHVDRKGYKSVALLRWPDAFGEELARALREELKTRHIAVVYDDSTSTMGHDFRAIFPAMLARRPDVIVTNLGDPQILTFMKQLRESGKDTPVLSNYVVQTNSAPTAVLDGIEYTYPLNKSDSTSEKELFDKRFMARFGNEATPSANTYFAYDGLLALDAALQRCGAIDTGCIRSRIISDMKTGLSGEVKFNQDGSNDRPYGIKRIEGGQFHWMSQTASERQVAK